MGWDGCGTVKPVYSAGLICLQDTETQHNQSMQTGDVLVQELQGILGQQKPGLWE